MVMVKVARFVYPCACAAAFIVNSGQCGRVTQAAEIFATESLMTLSRGESGIPAIPSYHKGQWGKGSQGSA